MNLMTDEEIFFAIASKEGWTEREQPMKSMITLLGNPQKMTFNVPNEFLEMLQQKADSRNVKVPVIFNELIQLKKLYRILWINLKKKSKIT